MPPLITTINDNTLLQLVQLLAAGKLVCFPTETVYALAADSRNDEAVDRIYAAKGRDVHVPLALLVATIEEARKLVVFNHQAEQLASRFFPGPLTLVLPANPNAQLSSHLNRGKNTIAIRIPDHPIALTILKAFGHPLVGTSTNISGQPSATSVQTIDNKVKNHLNLIIDGGQSALQKGSTIVDLTTESPTILREGTLTKEVILQALQENSYAL